MLSFKQMRNVMHNKEISINAMIRQMELSSNTNDEALVLAKSVIMQQKMYITFLKNHIRNIEGE